MNIEIEGIQVIFPYKPYDIQINYMTAVINALQNKQNAILESPTGTGKTLSLLCSTLAWLEHKKFQDLNRIEPISADDFQLKITNSQSTAKKGKTKGWKNESPLRIIYSSRTHSQLNQACNELKNCYYKFTPTVTIGSRDQLCINPEVTSLEFISAKNQTCRYKVKNNQCNFHHNYERKVSDLSFCGTKVYDIEDLVKFGNENKACPYYMSKALTDFNTSLTFMPYNYVLDPSIRKTLKLNLENSVIIFDEGHNIERVCEESMSTELKSEWLALFIKSFDQTLVALKELNDGTYQGFNNKDLEELNIHEVAQVKLTISDLEMELDHLAIRKKNEANIQFNTKEIFEIMNRIKLDYERCTLICNVCEKITSFVMNSGTSFMTNQTIAALISVCSFLEMIMPYSNLKQDEFIQYKSEFIRNYKLHVELESEMNNQKKTWLQNLDSKKGWTVYLWCMSPSVAIKSLQRNGVYNLIITSGTLSPLESFECEMGIPFAVKLRNEHVISRNQLSVQFISNDPNGYELCGSFEKRNDSKYYAGLGWTVLELSRYIPKGLLIFFSSYPLMNRCIETWKGKPNIWALISKSKQIFIEARNKKEFNEHLQFYKNAIEKNDGAIFMGVSRGKLSEGLDMGDDYCRGVMIVGLPYPARYDPKVVLKQKYLNENNCKLNGSQWYMLQMKRALNQSIGRVIRHKSDYGMIILCDSRFKQLNDGFAKWILPFLDKNKENIAFKVQMQNIGMFYGKHSSGEISNVHNEPNKSSNKKSTVVNEDSNDNNINDNQDEIKNMFKQMKNNYTNIINKNQNYGKFTKTTNNHQSIFDTFDSPVINKRKSTENQKENSNKKICPNGSEEKLNSQIQNEEVSTLLQSKEVEIIKKDFLVTEKNLQTFNVIIDQICFSPVKCRQFIECLRVFHKKRNPNYLALRMNYILSTISQDKRLDIIKDLSLFVPESERDVFLKYCKVKH